ncbi:MAG: hypothetical protein QOJ84_4679 [Bradyrhizobium sp.]|jgi:hypothetical protein|nr:hypothetical protein [Bradyrhizobium sp.]
MKSKSRTQEIELHPDAWKRFERAAGVVAKSPPQHRVKQKEKVANVGKTTKPRAKK